jgi:neurotransmitter:Na+ symporter, NSS family
MIAKEQWTGRLAIIIAAVSMAVGTGNIWRFPRMAAQWGGGAFLIAVTVALLLWAVPLMMAELYMGSKSRLGNIGTFRDFMGRRYTWAGAFMASVTIMIMFYYAVVVGWCLRYLVFALLGNIEPGISGQQEWDAFTGDARQTIGFHFIAVLLTTLVVVRGIQGGLERVLKVMLPALLLVLVILFFGAVTQDGASQGLRFLFVPDWPVLLNERVWLEAFTQVAWSTGAGWGLLMVYAVYAREREDIAVNSGIISFSDILVGFLAASIVLATIFALAPTAEYAHDAIGAGNVGLTFIYVIELLAVMPGSAVLAPLFFLALALAGVSSLIAMFELATTNLLNFGITRRRAAIATGVAAFVFGIPSAVSVDFLDNQDWVWGVGLLISGLLTAIAIMRYGVERARAEIDALSDMRVGAWWSWLIRLIPVLFLFVFGWWVLRSTTWYPGEWWNPLLKESTGTMVVQWLIVFAVVFALNNYFARRVTAGPMTADPAAPPD